MITYQIAKSHCQVSGALPYDNYVAFHRIVLGTVSAATEWCSKLASLEFFVCFVVIKLTNAPIIWKNGPSLMDGHRLWCKSSLTHPRNMAIELARTEVSYLLLVISLRPMEERISPRFETRLTLR